jgi:hypothetical protein
MFHKVIEDGRKIESSGEAYRYCISNQSENGIPTNKIEELDRRRNMEKSVLSGLLEIKAYDIMLHTLATNECQELSSKFEERSRQSLVAIMDLYDKSIQDVHKYLQWNDINF